MAYFYLAQLILPFAAIAWLGLAPAEGARVRALQMGGVIAFVVGFWLAGAWFYPPEDIRWFQGLILAAAVLRAATVPWGPAPPSSLWSTSALSVLAAALGLFAITQSVLGRSPSGATFSLNAPLTDGSFCVLSGGAAPLLNLHMATFAPPYASIRGRRYGIDFVAVNDDGLRADSIHPAPTDLDDYEIFGATIVAPCAGRVIEARDGISDNAIGDNRDSGVSGNFVLLECSGHHVLLEHMQRDSVRIQTGDRVRTGQRLGLVGNSGFSTEPHLHIHVQSVATGNPVGPLIDGNFLTRGDCLD